MLCSAKDINFKFDKRVLHADRTKAENSVIIFLRIKKINLNAFLYKQNVFKYISAIYK